jgi:hypothetical protein
MKKVIATVALLFATSAFAACPPYAPYGCQMMPNGKMLCGCGR